MKRARSKTILLVLLLAAVILGALATAAFYCFRAYEERKNYERTADYYMSMYLYGALSISDAWYMEYRDSPLDLQALIDDLRLIPPPNPYREDHKTIFTTLDKRIPGAVWYIPGPVEFPDRCASGLFLSKRYSGRDEITESDDPWIIGWSLSKPDGIPDGMISGMNFEGTEYSDTKPLDNPSVKWEIEWKGTLLTWRYSDGSEVDFTADRFISKLEDYQKRHPENFADNKRPRMPKGYFKSKRDLERTSLTDFEKERIARFYGLDTAVVDEKAKK